MNSTKTTRTLWNNVSVPISTILVLVLNKSVLHVMALVEQLKQHVAKRSIQMYFNNQILDYKAILDLCENEMVSKIKLLGICKKSIISAENFETEKWYKGGDTVSVTRSSNHLLPLSPSWLGPKLTSEDESYVDILLISFCDLCIQLVLVGWHD